MASRAEITTKYAKAYVKASKKDKGLILDQVMSVTGWSRDNARRRLAAGGETAARDGPQCRCAAPEAADPEVFLCRAEGAAEGVGRFGWAVREVPCRVHGAAARWVATARRVGVRA